MIALSRSINSVLDSPEGYSEPPQAGLNLTLEILVYSPCLIYYLFDY